MSAYKIPRYRCKLVRDGATASERVDNAGAALATLRRLTDDLPFEQVWVFYLNGQNTLIGCEKISQGGAHGAAITPVEVFRGAILASATAIIIGHNHPSGNGHPSAEDIRLTSHVAKAGAILGIPLLDHVIIGCGTDSQSSLRDTHSHCFEAA